MAQSFTLKLDEVEYSVEVDGDTVIVDGQPFTVGAEGNESVVIMFVRWNATARPALPFDIRRERDGRGGLWLGEGAGRCQAWDVHGGKTARGMQAHAANASPTPTRPPVPSQAFGQ